MLPEELPRRAAARGSWLLSLPEEKKNLRPACAQEIRSEAFFGRERGSASRNGCGEPWRAGRDRQMREKIRRKPSCTTEFAYACGSPGPHRAGVWPSCWNLWKLTKPLAWRTAPKPNCKAFWSGWRGRSVAVRCARKRARDEHAV